MQHHEHFMRGWGVESCILRKPSLAHWSTQLGLQDCPIRHRCCDSYTVVFHISFNGLRSTLKNEQRARWRTAEVRYCLILNLHRPLCPGKWKARVSSTPKAKNKYSLKNILSGFCSLLPYVCLFQGLILIGKSLSQ